VPAIAARLASSASAKEGKIHQVIGAVVDGEFCPDGKAFFHRTSADALA
jgi:hypothetical protein